MGKERMLITGGHALEGEVRVSGGKNTAVAVIPATLLSDEPCTIENLPDIEDVHALADILTELGAKVDYEPGRMTVDPREGSEWFNELREDGSSLGKPMVEEWKCPYHNGRMCLRLIGGGLPGIL